MSFWSAKYWRQHLVLAHPAHRAVLLQEGPSGWALPLVEMEAGHPGDVAKLVQGVRDAFDLDVRVRGCLRHDFDPVTRVAQWVREVEGHGQNWTLPPTARWIGAGELESLTLACPEHGPLLTEWLAGRLPARAPWEHRGWLDHAVAWSQSALARYGAGTIEDVTQVRAWEFSSVLRLTAGGRPYFLKAVPAGRAREMRMTRRIAERWPHLVAPVIATDLDRAWMLMAGVEGPALEDVQDLRRWEAAARAYAELQIGWIDHGTELLALGASDLRPARLAHEIDASLADESTLAPGLRRDLRRAEIEALRRLSPALQRGCADLQGRAIPNTLEHADLWASNIIDTDSGPVIIDWEDACLSHPFFSLWYLLQSSDWLDPRPTTRGRIRDAYLEPWARYGSPGELRATFDLAQRLAPLSAAVTFRLDVVPLLDASWELREFVPFFLRHLLAAWADQPA